MKGLTEPRLPPSLSTENPMPSPTSDTPSCQRAPNKELQKPLQTLAPIPSLIPSFSFILYLVCSIYLIMYRTLNLLLKGLFYFPLSVTLLKNWVPICLQEWLKNLKRCIKCSLCTLLPIVVTQIVPLVRWPQSTS